MFNPVVSITCRMESNNTAPEAKPIIRVLYTGAWHCNN
nr:MAG TPA: hypothetical protein [Caudoviricetes sp.]